MKRLYALVVLIAWLFTACKGGGKKSMRGNDKIEASDFIAFFNDIKLPYLITDSVFLKKPADSLLVDTSVFKQFVSDTIFSKDFPKLPTQLYAIGKFKNPEAETYLLFRAVSNRKQVIYAAAFTTENSFSASMPLISSAGGTGSEKVVIDPKFVFNRTTNTKGKDGSVSPVNEVYAYNNAGLFMMILTDGLPAGTELPIIDPIDSFPRKGRWAGNYMKDKRNLLTIRDAGNAQEIKIFIHIEKKTSSLCEGELKSEATMNSKDSATYTGNGDPCILGFKFFANSIRITEINCGNRHGMECSFNGVYKKVKEPKPAQKPKK